MLRYRYSQWDGTQQVFAPDHRQLMEELADDLMEHGDVQRALRDLYRRGMRGPEAERLEGLRELLERLRARRQQELQRTNMDSMMDDLRQRLDGVVDTERRGIDKRLQEAHERRKADPEDETFQKLLEKLQEQAQRSREELDNLPESPGGAIRRLSEYEFMDSEAARKFQELMEMLQGRMLQNFSQNLRHSLEQMDPQEMAALREMLHQLNEMVGQMRNGEQPDFQSFMERYGQFFGPNPPGSMEELLERIAQQMGAMQSLMDSMSPEQRRELEEALDSVLDEATAREMAELARSLAELMPEDQIRDHRFLGDEPITLDQALELMKELHSMDQLEQQIQEVTRRGDIEELDPELVKRLLGSEAGRSTEQLQRLAKLLEEAGYVQRKGDRLELSPAGIRKIGQTALKEVFLEIKKERLGRHDMSRRGQGGERSGVSRPYQFGDPLELDLHRSFLNSIIRSGPGIPLRLKVTDFEVQETEHVTQTATCLLLDQSRSMGMMGSWQAAKRVCMALTALIEHQFTRDTLYVIGFSDYATEIKPGEVPHLSWNGWVPGTNMHHALMLSRRLLSRHKNATRQVLMITDGEPTAHLEGNYSAFSYPPSYRTIQETLKAVRQCTRDGITINTFMLDSSLGLQGFVDQLTRINGGRAFYSTPDRLGEYVLVDYVAHRKKRLGS